jgi:hypothetical protein
VKLFFIASRTTALLPVICGNDTVTASCAEANRGLSDIEATQIILKIFIIG